MRQAEHKTLIKWCSMRGRAVVARRAHNPEVVGSNPTPATKKLSRQDDFQSHPAFLQVPDALKAIQRERNFAGTFLVAAVSSNR